MVRFLQVKLPTGILLSQDSGHFADPYLAVGMTVPLRHSFALTGEL